MNRTLLLLSAAGLLALGALSLGRPPPPPPPPVTDTSHTVAQPDEQPATAVLPLIVAQPSDGALTLSGKLSGAYVQPGASEAFAWMEIKARPIESGRRVPVNMALVVDRSGSMEGQKLTDAKRAAAELVSRLTPEDRLALIHYGTDTKVIASRLVTDAFREELLAAISAIRADGSTNISGGLSDAATALRGHLAQYRVSRAILLSDGQPTTGFVTEPELFNLTRSLRDEGITVSALGVGEDFQASLMRGMAEQGGGFSGFIDNSARLAEVFSRELDQATSTVARRVELRLTLPPGVRDVEVMGLPTTREGNVVKVPLYDLASAQSVRVVVKLTLRATASTEPVRLLDATVRYLDVARDATAEATLPLSAQVTEDAALVRAHLDRDVRVHAVRALGTQQMRAAVEEMKRGNRKAAVGLLGNAKKLFGSSPSALSGELAELDQTEAAYGRASNDGDVRRESLNLYKKTMKNFGENNAY
ncbi:MULTISPECIES: VWA domain-containing protein [Myxococcus]|uniref:VWA domain-containing protein n=1 Tax=Myxococcus llanfairpwllgwyngyllgogerychwyrndrobwllllantysiliogogogochensis TaxID=2590453 RepID=A0A540X5U1_9BACT|nr:MULTISPECIES: VWA domain-containing protein [Myxococcus]NTX05689.1 VWA domain-containing protein [Myxococcus sp. CA040A]TQF16617.1 VWA domain-containing protein [Myxococcus llanfairpwllgwyngyllgogerychwyrndrobwllllantysiliogogogochensis]